MVRISGKDAVAIVDKVWRGRELSRAASHTAHLGEIVEESGEVLDQAVATVFRAPKSFTGEDVVEVSVHGSRWIQREVVNLLVRNGCRVAMPGESLILTTAMPPIPGGVDTAQIVSSIIFSVLVYSNSGNGTPTPPAPQHHQEAR